MPIAAAPLLKISNLQGRGAAIELVGLAAMLANRVLEAHQVLVH